MLIVCMFVSSLLWWAHIGRMLLWPAAFCSREASSSSLPACRFFRMLFMVPSIPYFPGWVPFFFFQCGCGSLFAQSCGCLVVFGSDLGGRAFHLPSQHIHGLFPGREWFSWRAAFSVPGSSAIHDWASGIADPVLISLDISCCLSPCL